MNWLNKYTLLEKKDKSELNKKNIFIGDLVAPMADLIQMTRIQVHQFD